MSSHSIKNWFSWLRNVRHSTEPKRETFHQISSLEWDNADKEKAPPAVVEEAAVADAAPVANAAPHEQVAELEARISQLTDDNEQYQDLLEELKGEYQAAEAQLNAEINRLKAQLQQQVAPHIRFSVSFPFFRPQVSLDLPMTIQLAFILRSLGTCSVVFSSLISLILSHDLFWPS